MPHEFGYGTPDAPLTDWAANAEGGRVAVNDVYQLRELLGRLAVQIDLPDDSPDDLRWANANGQFKLVVEQPRAGYSTPSLLEIGQAPSHSHFNADWMTGDRTDPYNMVVNSFGVFSIIRDGYNSHYNADETSRPSYLAFNTDSSSLEYEYGQRFDGTSNENGFLSDADVVFELSAGFWDSVGELINRPTSSPILQVSSGSSLFEGQVLDLGSVAQNLPGFGEFSDFIRSSLAISIQSDISLPEYEFSPHTWGELIFVHQSSGQSIYLNQQDLDDSWLMGGSGLGSVDPIYDEQGNAIATEFEFGLSDHGSWSISDLLKKAEQAYRSDWAVGASGLTPFDGLSKWQLEGARINNNANGLVTNAQHLDSALADLIDSVDYHFYTKPLSATLPTNTISPVQFAISDFDGPSFDISTLDAEFNLDLVGPSLASLIGIPAFENYSGQVRLTPDYDTAAIPLGYGEAGNIEISFNRHLDGLADDSINVRRHGTTNLAELYPDLASSDLPLNYRLESLRLMASPFDSASMGSGWSEVSFWVDSLGNVSRSSSGNYFDSVTEISQAAPNWGLLQDISVTGVFDSAEFLAPLSVKGTLLSDSWGTAQEAVGFRYGLRTASSVEDLTQLAVLGQTVDQSQYYYLDIYGTSLLEEFSIESLDFTVGLDTSLFDWFAESDIQISSSLPVANSARIDRDGGLIRFAGASVESAGAGESISHGQEALIASIRLNFNEAQLRTLTKNSDGSLSASPFSVDISANANETILTRSFLDDIGSNAEIRTLASLGGEIAVIGQEVTLYDAFINLEQLGDGLILGTERVIGADAGFTNLIRKGDTVRASVDWLNVGNVRADDLVVHQHYNANGHLVLEESSFTLSGIDSGRFVEGVYVPDERQQTTLNAAVRVTGEAGNVLDVADGLFAVQATSSEQFNNDGLGTSNLITFQGDLNYDGRVSMKDLAYLNAGAARQKSIAQDPFGIDADLNGIIDLTVARDVDANYDGKIDLSDLAILDQDWGKSLHLGDQQFQGSADVSWEELDLQSPTAAWDNSSFKEQNAIEASPSYVGSLESPAAINVIGADGNSSPNDGDMLGTYYQDSV